MLSTKRALLRTAAGVAVAGVLVVGTHDPELRSERSAERKSVHTATAEAATPALITTTTTTLIQTTTTTAPPPPPTTQAPARRLQPPPTTVPVTAPPTTVPAAPGSVESLILATWGPEAGPGAVRVARCESGLNPHARNGVHVGVFQLSGRWHQARAQRLGYSWEQVSTTASANIAVAYNLYQEQGWRPWTCKP